MFRPDQPIQSFKEDILNRRQFAKALGKAILSHKDENSVAIGLFGSWGSGKTSIVNMALEHIDELSKDIPDEEKQIVLRFNPWNFSDQNQLISQFFKQLSGVLKRKGLGEEARKAGEQLENYGALFEPLALVSLFGPGAVVVGKCVSWLGSVLGKWGKQRSGDLVLIKKTLNTSLSKLKRKIIVVIDDIDRLNNVEIRQIFQLVKSLCDFKNTIYFLVFDKHVVIKALSEVQAGEGSDYLEKVVQVPFEIPTISKEDLHDFLFSQLNSLGISEEKWGQTYWGNIFHSGLKYFFRTLRDVNRYINALRFSFEMVKDLVNPVDFLAIVGIQVFLPDVYYGIRDNKDLFVGISKSGSQTITDQEKKRCDEILARNQSIPQDVLLDLLKRLFPKLESVYSNNNYGADWLDNWRKEGKVCSPDVFDVYFQLTLPANEVSHKEMETMLSLADEPEALKDAILDLNSDGRILRFLERMEDYTKDFILKENIENIISVLMDIGDLFPEGKTNFFATDTPMRLLRIFYQLANRFETKQERFNVFKKSIESATQSLYVIVHEVGVQDQQHGKYGLSDKPKPEENWTVDENQLLELEKLARIKIEEWANDGRLKSHDKLASILFRWRDWGKEEDVMAFVADMIKDDSGLINFVTVFTGKSFSFGMSDHVGRMQWRIDLKSVDRFVDSKILEPRLRKILSSALFNQLEEKQKSAVKTFLDTFDGKLKDY
jgi:predicted KAP-like P-loop ATPase